MKLEKKMAIFCYTGVLVPLTTNRTFKNVYDVPGRRDALALTSSTGGFSNLTVIRCLKNSIASTIRVV